MNAEDIKKRYDSQVMIGWVGSLAAGAIVGAILASFLPAVIGLIAFVVVAWAGIRFWNRRAAAERDAALARLEQAPKPAAAPKPEPAPAPAQRPAPSPEAAPAPTADAPAAPPAAPRAAKPAPEAPAGEDARRAALREAYAAAEKEKATRDAVAKARARRGGGA